MILMSKREHVQKQMREQQNGQSILKTGLIGLYREENLMESVEQTIINISKGNPGCMQFCFELLKKGGYELQRTFHETAEATTSVISALDEMTLNMLRMIEQHKAKAAPGTQVEVAIILSKKRKDGKRRKRR